MCLLILAHHAVPDIPLVVAANRDEFHARPTEPARFWDAYPDLLAGRDLQQGGTWMGVTRSGRFAAITNFRDPGATAQAPRSRGELPLEYLAGSLSPADYLASVAACATEYAGFNLLVGDGTTLWHLHNSPGGAPHQLEPGIYGLSNARLDTPWPKVELGKQRLAETLSRSELDHDKLTAVIADRRLATPEALRLHGQETDMEITLSAQFIVGDAYGTRSTTTLWWDRGGIHWRELSFDAGGECSSSREESFTPAVRARQGERE